jgi:hypothetical protein
MAYSNVSQGIGNTRTAGVSDRSLAIKVFSGEVLTAFETSNIFLSKVQNRTIASGKSASFAVIGKYASAVDTHVPGTDITPNLINAGERVIEIDDLKYASVFVDSFEEAMQHYETRSQYSTEMGRRLSKTVDLAVIAQLDACVAGTANAGDTNGGEGQPAAQTAIAIGTIAAGTANGLKGDAILAALFDADTAMEEDDIPGDRSVVMSPKNYNRLVQSGAVNKDMTTNNGGLDSGTVTQIAGHNIMVSNNVGVNDIYMFTQNAVGVVKLLDIKSEVNYIPEKLGDLMTSSYAMGFGVLNNGCVVKMSTDD